jgi:hypothetical protein
MTEVAKMGDWVRVKNTILKVGERAPQVPDATKQVPLEMWTNGFMQNSEAKIGDAVEITTLAERTLAGTLVEVMPGYKVDYGQPQPELLAIGREIRAVLEEVTKNG